jgi:hypothetical protein
MTASVFGGTPWGTVSRPGPSKSVRKEEGEDEKERRNNEESFLSPGTGGAMMLALLLAGIAGVQEYPILDRVDEKVIQEYQQSTCQRLWQERGQPKPVMEERVVEMLRSDPQMRQVLINKVAAPIANNMFECGMIP